MTTERPTGPLRVGILNLLSGNLTDLGGGSVTVTTKAAAALPHVRLATVFVDPNASPVGAEGLVQVDVFSGYDGTKEVDHIAGQVFSILSQQTPTVAGFRVILSRIVRDSTLPTVTAQGDPAHHCIIEIRYRLNQA